MLWEGAFLKCLENYQSVLRLSGWPLINVNLQLIKKTGEHDKDEGGEGENKNRIFCVVSNFIVL